MLLKILGGQRAFDRFGVPPDIEGNFIEIGGGGRGFLARRRSIVPDVLPGRGWMVDGAIKKAEPAHLINNIGPIAIAITMEEWSAIAISNEQRRVSIAMTLTMRWHRAAAKPSLAATAAVKRARDIGGVHSVGPRKIGASTSRRVTSSTNFGSPLFGSM